MAWHIKPGGAHRLGARAGQAQWMRKLSKKHSEKDLMQSLVAVDD